MSNVNFSQLTAWTGSIDIANDLVAVWKNSNSTLYKATPNQLANLASQWVGTTDSQTLTNKTLTAPTISGPTLSGTVIGTYTIGGTPTFPSSVATLTGSQTLTNKVLTSPTINGGILDNATVTVDAVSGHTSPTTGTVYGIAVTSGTIGSAALAANAVTTTAINANAVTFSKVAAGFAVQVVSTDFSAVATGTTLLPFDDTIPQNTEGDQYMTQAITPKSASNHLLITANAWLSNSAGPNDISAALFQDSTANALAATDVTQSTNAYVMRAMIVHDMVAGTTSSTTFKIRAGGSGAGTTTFNGQGGARKFGGITLSNITIVEYTV